MIALLLGVCDDSRKPVAIYLLREFRSLYRADDCIRVVCTAIFFVFIYRIPVRRVIQYTYAI